MTTIIRTTIFAAALLLGSQAMARAGSPGGIGVLGDSYSDEYQFYPPDRTTARNWVEILAATRGLDFGPYSAGSRGEPRNQGYAFNWARSDATTESLVASGQHTGLAAQVARGEVGLVVIFIGGNDFINALKGSNPVRAVEEVLPRALANHWLAVRTILDASPHVKVAVATLPDIRHLPEFARPLHEGRLPVATADVFTEAIWRYNAQIRSLAAGHPRVALIDLDMATRAANLLSTEYAFVDGRKLDRLHPGNTLDRFFLADVRHPGTLGQGIMARLFVETVNAKFGAGIPPLESREVLALARSVAHPADPAVKHVSLGDPKGIHTSRNVHDALRSNGMISQRKSEANRRKTSPVAVPVRTAGRLNLEIDGFSERDLPLLRDPANLSKKSGPVMSSIERQLGQGQAAARDGRGVGREFLGPFARISSLLFPLFPSRRQSLSPRFRLG